MKKIILGVDQKISSVSGSCQSRKALEQLKQYFKRRGAYSSLFPLLLAACGGGGSGPKPPPPPPPPEPDFTENPSNTFTARDNNDRTLSESSATADLIVYGKDGNDTITMGSGADMILPGAGADAVNAGDGDDIIVLVGATSTDQYTESAITNPAGIGADLSALLSLADINGHTVSDVVSGETLDGGAGNNTLVIYGDVDISGITVTNLTQLWVNSTLTLTAAQFSAMTAVTGDGTSVLNIVGSATAGTFDQVDLSSISLSGIDTIFLDGNVELVISDVSQLAGISEDLTSSSLIVAIASGATINISDLLEPLSNLEHYELAVGATLVLDTVEAVNLLGAMSFGGSGTIVVSDAVAAVSGSLSAIRIDDDILLQGSTGIGVDITTLGGVLVPDLDEGSSELPVVSLGPETTVYEADGSLTINLELNVAYFDVVTVHFNSSGQVNWTYATVEFSPGEVEQTFTFTWDDNADYNVTSYLAIDLLSPTNATIGNQSGVFTILDDEAVEPDGSPDILASLETTATVAIGETLEGQITHEEDEDWVRIDAVEGHVYLVEIIGADGNGGTMITPDALRIHSGSAEVLDGVHSGAADGQIYFDAGSADSYFIIIDGTPGTYTLSVTEVDISEPDGAVDIGDDTAGAAPVLLDTPLEQGISYNGDTDMFAATLEAGVAYQIDVQGAATGNGTLLDPALGGYLGTLGDLIPLYDEPIDHDNNLASLLDDQKIFMVEESGTYYFDVSGSGGSGTYTVTLTTPLLSEPDGSDDIGNTIATAQTVFDGDIIDASIGYAGDQDWFVLTMTAGEVYSLYATTLWPEGYVHGGYTSSFSASVWGAYAADGTLTWGAGTMFGSEFQDISVNHFMAHEDGTYYFQVSTDLFDVEQDYQLSVVQADTTEPDGSADVAGDISSITAITAGGQIDGSLHTSLDLDYYQINLAANELYLIDLSVALNGEGLREWTQISIFNDQDEEVASWSQDINGGIEGYGIYYEPEQAGPYYIKVGAADILYEIDYTVSLTYIHTQEPDGSHDYGNSLETADFHDITTTLSGAIFDRFDKYDVDWLAVELVAGQSYTFTMSGDDTNGNALAVADIYKIYDFYGNGYFGTEGENISIDGSDNLTFTAHYSGTFYLELTNGNSTGAGDYRLVTALTGLTEPDETADISSWIDTTATIAIGASATGSVGLEYDRDWYAVEFVEGNVYQITLTGVASGTGTLVDPRIEGIYDENGNAFTGAFNDDGGGATRESLMLFTAPYSGTFYIAAGGWDIEVGSYELTVADVSSTHAEDLQYGPTNGESFPLTEDVALTDNILVDSLLSGFRFSTDPDGSTTTITYSFPSVNSYYSSRDIIGYDGYEGGFNEPWTEFAPLTDDQAVLYQQVATYIETIANIDMVQVADTFGSAGTIRIAWTNMENEDSAAWAYYPYAYPWGGDIWLKTDGIDDPSDDNYMTYIYLHETGHAIGLKHPFENNDGTSPVMPARYDGHDYTVMAYNFSADRPYATYTDLYPQTYMYYDILALQYLYGAVEANVGDTTYTFDGNERYFLTLWDTDGNDTIEFINQQSAVEIYLNGIDFSQSGDGGDSILSGGVWWDVGTTIHYEGNETREDTVYVPEEITIENLYGTQFDDQLHGNDADNKLRGLDGGDYISGNAGNDILDGGPGDNADILVGGSGNDIFVTRPGDGGNVINAADLVLDFTDGEDLIGLNGLTFDELTIEAGTLGFTGDTVISVTATGEFLMVLDEVDASLVTADDFTQIADEWWLA